MNILITSAVSFTTATILTYLISIWSEPIHFEGAAKEYISRKKAIDTVLMGLIGIDTVVHVLWWFILDIMEYF